MAARIEDVARRAGVSTATVSRVLAGKPHVRPEARARVMSAATELDYRPSRLARSLRVQRARVIGLIISDIENPFFTSVVRAVEDIAYRHQHSLLLCNSDEDPAKEALYIDLMLAEKVAGVIVSPTHETDSSCQRLADAATPVVVIDRRTRQVEVDTVVVDNVGAAYELVSHLITDGHRRIGAVLGTLAATTGHERYEGYCRALAAHRLNVCPELVRSGAPNRETGYRLTKELLDLPQPPTALFAGNNLLTIGTLQAIYERGLRIPADVALVAFDEMDWMFVMNPALTVAAQPAYEIGRVAATLLVERIADRTRPVREVMLTPTVHIRGSCAPHV